VAENCDLTNNIVLILIALVSTFVAFSFEMLDDIINSLKEVMDAVVIQIFVMDIIFMAYRIRMKG